MEECSGRFGRSAGWAGRPAHSHGDRNSARDEARAAERTKSKKTVSKREMSTDLPMQWPPPSRAPQAGAREPYANGIEAALQLECIAMVIRLALVDESASFSPAASALARLMTDRATSLRCLLSRVSSSVCRA